MMPSGLLNVSQAWANSATTPSVLVEGVPSIASAIASDGNGPLDVGACDARGCCGDRRQCLIELSKSTRLLKSSPVV
jgi:hypothetical protein